MRSSCVRSSRIPSRCSSASSDSASAVAASAFHSADRCLTRSRASVRCHRPLAASARRRRRCAGHGIVVVERHDERRRERLVVDARRPIGRQLRRRPRVRQRGLRPAVLVRRVHRRVEMQVLDLPDIALLHVLVLEHAEAPSRVLVVHGLLRKHVPAALRRAAVGSDVHDRLQLHLIEQAARPAEIPGH